MAQVVKVQISRPYAIAANTLSSSGVIPPFLEHAKSRGYAARANFCFDVIPPRAMLGRS
jgi:hypothetical protein